MHLIIKEGDERDVFRCQVCPGGKLIINLYHRWPETVFFEPSTQDFIIKPTAQGEKVIRIRPSAPITVSNIQVEKDQVIVWYEPTC